jgi:hypothetical protein
MSDGAYVAAAAAATAHAIKASGAIVSVGPQDFLSILHKTERPLVVTAEERFLRAVYKYLTSYRGLVFFTKTKEQLHLPSDVELVISKKIWIPS